MESPEVLDLTKQTSCLKACRAMDLFDLITAMVPFLTHKQLLEAVPIVQGLCCQPSVLHKFWPFLAAIGLSKCPEEPQVNAFTCNITIIVPC